MDADWKCISCGAPAPERVRPLTCQQGCPSGLVFRKLADGKQQVEDENRLPGHGGASCLCCGRVGTPKVWHAEHPEIYVCGRCHSAAQASAEAAPRGGGEAVDSWEWEPLPEDAYERQSFDLLTADIPNGAAKHIATSLASLTRGMELSGRPPSYMQALRVFANEVAKLRTHTPASEDRAGKDGERA